MSESELPTLEFWFDYGCCLWVKGGAFNRRQAAYIGQFKTQVESPYRRILGLS